MAESFDAPQSPPIDREPTVDQVPAPLWSEPFRKAVVFAIALQMRESAEDDASDHRNVLHHGSEKILRLATGDEAFLQDNRDFLLDGLNEGQVREFARELARP